MFSNHCKPFVTLLLVLLVAGLMAPTAHAQRSQAIQGLVTDATGAVIPGATVKITNVGTGVERTATTNATGNYSFLLVEVGNYIVSCQLEGFKVQTATDIRVDTGAQVRRDFTLEVGDVTETVEVSAGAVTLNTENATVGTVIENKRVVELPLNGRNIVQLAVLVPGVQFGNRTGLNNGQGGYANNGSYSVSANGVRELHQVVAMDGMDTSDVRRSVTPFIPSIEAIEEFKIQTNSFSAENGFGGGAVTNITLKSGTNEFHGTAFEFLRNNAVNAEPYFLNFERPAGQRAEPNQQIKNQFGVVLSGPIVKNKTFWMFDWEARREVTKNVQEAFFPLAEHRQGNFSELLGGTINSETGRLFRNPIIVYDPFTGDPFPNNMVPADRHHPGIVNNFLNSGGFVPQADFRNPNNDPLDFTRRQGVTDPLTVNQYYTKIDHHFSDKDRIFGRMAIDRTDFTDFRINPNFYRWTDLETLNIATQWIHTFSPTMMNELRFGLQNFARNSGNPRTGDESFSMDALGIGEFRVAPDNNRPLTTDEHGVPDFNLYGIDEHRDFNNPDHYVWANHFSLIKGSHNIRLGAEIYHKRAYDADANLATGLVNMGNGETGLSHASFLMGIPADVTSAEGVALTVPRSTQQGYYIQDDWKMTSRVTVNLGFRFDYIGNVKDRDGLLRTLVFPNENHPEGLAVGNGGYQDPDTGQLIPTMGPPSLGSDGAVKLWRQDTRFFMPRIGIAWRPTEKWVVRTGAGYFDNIMHWNAYTILNLNPPKSGSVFFQQVTDNVSTIPVVAVDGNTYNVQTRKIRDTNRAITLNDPFLRAVGGVSDRAGNPVATLYANPEFKDGDVWKWSFDIQRELPFSTSLTIGYVGSKSSHVGSSIRNWNGADPSPNTNAQSRRPWQRFYDPATPELGVQGLSIVRFLDTYGNSFHQGLQVKLDKRFSNGIAFGLAYAFSKSHGDGEAGGNEGAEYQNPRVDRSDARGRFRFDQRHNLVAHYVWELPGQNMSSALRHVIGGWQTNGILSLRSGLPFRIATNGNDLNTGNDSAIRPDLVGDPYVSNPNRKLWYNGSAFQRVSCDIPSRQDLCHFGNFGYNVLDSPGQATMDFGLFKNFAITERMKIQFRSEFFNAFNTPYFGAPSGLSFSSTNAIVPDGARVGEIRGTRQDMRVIQFGLKLSF